MEFDDTTTEKDIFSAVSKAGYKAVAINQEDKGQNIGVLIAMLVLSFVLLANKDCAPYAHLPYISK